MMKKKEQTIYYRPALLMALWARNRKKINKVWNQWKGKGSDWNLQNFNEMHFVLIQTGISISFSF